MSAIAAENVSKHWTTAEGKVHAVDGVSFAFDEGTLNVLLGPSGCGKSTTLRLIAGLEQSDGGRILIGGRDVTRRPPSQRNISMVFQSYALFPHLSVAENIVFGLKVRNVAPNEVRERLQRVADLLGLAALLDRKPSQLSGGQQQRVALGRAIIAQAPVCLMDEPLSNLDAQLRHEMRSEIRALQRKLGITMVYVTHDQVEAMSMADRVVLLNHGRIEQNATPVELYDTPANTFVARFIGTPPMNLLPLDRHADGAVVAGTTAPIVAPAECAGMTLGVRLDPNRPPATWEEQLAYAQKLTKRDASGKVTQWGIQIPSSGFPYWLFQALAIQNGVQLMNDAGTQTYYDRPEVIEALQYWVDLATKQKVHPEGVVDWGTTPKDFFERKMAMMWTTTGNLTNVKTNAKFDFGVAMLPSGKQRGSPTGGGNFYLFKKTTPQQREAAVKFIKWMTTPQRAAQWCIDTGYVAVRADAWETPVMKQYVSGFPAAAVARDQLPYAKAELSTHDNQRVTKALNDGLQAALTGSKPADQAMKDAQREAERLLRPFR